MSTLLRHVDRHESIRYGDRSRSRTRIPPFSNTPAPPAESWRSAARLPQLQTADAQPHLRRARERCHRQLRTLSAELAGSGRTPPDSDRPGLDAFRMKSIDSTI